MSKNDNDLLEQMNAAYGAGGGQDPLLQQMDQAFNKKSSVNKKSTLGDVATQTGHGLTKFGLGFVDLFESPTQAAYWLYDKAKGQDVDRPWLSDMATDILKREFNVDLNEKAQTLPGNIAHDVSQYVPSLVTGKALAEGIKTVGKEGIKKFAPKTGNFIEKAGEFLSKGALGKEAATITGAGAVTSGSLKDMGVDPMKAEMMAQLGLPSAYLGLRYGPTAAKNLLTSVKNKLSPANAARNQAANKFQDIIGAENIPEVNQAIEGYNPAEYPEGYMPTTAELTQNPGMAKETRARQGTTNRGGEAISNVEQAQQNAINESITNAGLVPGEGEEAYNYLQNYKQQMLDAQAAQQEVLNQNALNEAAQLAPYESSPATAGEQLREVARAEMQTLEQARQPAKEALDLAEKSTDRVKPSATRAYINEQLKTARGPLRAKLLQAKKLLRSNDNEFISKPNGKKVRMPPRVGELKGVRESITQSMSEVKPGSPMHKQYTQILKKLDQDLVHAPEYLAAKNAYRQASIPINELQRQTPIGKDIAKNVFGETKKPSSQIPKKYIYGEESIQNARALKPIMDQSPEAQRAMRGYVHRSIARDVIGEDGHIKVAKLNQWRKANPGAFELFPELEHSLENAKTAKITLDRAVKQNATAVRDFEQSMGNRILKTDPDKYVKTILSEKNSSKKMADTLKLLDSDSTGAAKESFKKAVVKDLNSTLSEKGTKGTIDYINNNKGALSQVFDENQMAVLEKINKTLLQKHSAQKLAKVPGSATSANMHTLADYIMGDEHLINTVVKEVGLSQIPGAKQLYKGYQGAKKGVTKFINNNAEALITEALLDPKAAKLLLENVAGKSQAQKSVLVKKLVQNAYRTKVQQGLHEYDEENAA